MESYLYYSNNTTTGSDTGANPVYKAVFRDRDDTRPDIYKFQKRGLRSRPGNDTHPQKGSCSKGWYRETTPSQSNLQNSQGASQEPEPYGSRVHDRPLPGQQQQPPPYTDTVSPDLDGTERTQRRVHFGQEASMTNQRQPGKTEPPRSVQHQGIVTGIELLPVRVQTYLDLAYGPVGGQLRRETVEPSDVIARGIFEELVFLDKAQRAVLREEIQKRAKWT